MVVCGHRCGCRGGHRLPQTYSRGRSRRLGSRIDFCHRWASIDENASASRMLTDSSEIDWAAS
nr:hypothetical protein JVH1_0135 [Rhodococcus sp. JVH1]